MIPGITALHYFFFLSFCCVDRTNIWWAICLTEGSLTGSGQRLPIVKEQRKQRQPTIMKHGYRAKKDPQGPQKRTVIVNRWWKQKAFHGERNIYPGPSRMDKTVLAEEGIGHFREINPENPKNRDSGASIVAQRVKLLPATPESHMSSSSPGCFRSSPTP